jgi:hypothetical protein
MPALACAMPRRALDVQLRPRLPLRITLILCVVLTTTAWNVVRAWTGVSWRVPLDVYARQPGSLYVALTGAAFALLGVAILWGFWRRASWAPRALLLGAWIYVLWVWADRLVFQMQDRSSWPFAAVSTAALLSWTTIVALDKRNQAYLGKEANERRFQHHPSA